MSGLNLSAAACNAATLSIARKALSFLRKPTCARVSSCSDEAVTVEIVSGLEGEEERARTHHHRTEHLIPDVEVVVGVAAALAGRGCGDAGPGWDISGTLMRKLGPCSMLLKMK